MVLVPHTGFGVWGIRRLTGMMPPARSNALRKPIVLFRNVMGTTSAVRVMCIKATLGWAPGKFKRVVRFCS